MIRNAGTLSLGLALAVALSLAPRHAAAEAPLSVGAGFSILLVERGAVFGWRADFGVELRPWLQVVGDVCGHYGHDGAEQWSIHHVLVGARFQLPRRVTPFATALIGPLVYTEENESGGHSSYGWFAVGIGGGVDVSIGPRFLLRAQADALWHAGVLVPNGRFTIGLVARLGAAPATRPPAR